MKIYLASFTSGVAVAVFLILFVLALSYYADEGQAANERVEYCTNVKEGVWPDFNENYQQLCVDNTR